MITMKESRYFEQLLKHYARSPSIVLCRVPELELLSRINPVHPILDHCCGDGLIAEMAFPGIRIDAGIDFSHRQLQKARKRGNFQELQWADAGVALPFPDECFSTVFNNSGLEHIPSLDKAIAEISRVLKRGGRLYVNVLNSRYFERWPLSPKTAEDYKTFQPFYHAMDEQGWEEILRGRHFQSMTFTDYFPEPASRILAALDYRHSAFYFRKALSFSVMCDRLLPESWLIRKWRKLFQSLDWGSPPGAGSGFLISATKA
jgi:ubiquinone/menaquinone biosynthesis C-methylase UbiE